jgi:hypothetical protein
MYLTLRALRVQGNFVWRLDQLQVDICLAVHMRLHSMSLAPSVPPQYHGNHHSYAIKAPLAKVGGRLSVCFFFFSLRTADWGKGDSGGPRKVV